MTPRSARRAGVLISTFVMLASAGCDRPREDGSEASPASSSELAATTLLDDVSLDSGLALARRVYREGDTRAGRDLLEAVAARALEAGDTAVRADALTWLSYASRWLTDYDRSRSAAEEAVRLRVRAGLDRELWRSHNALGLLSWWQSRLTEAMRHFDAALEAARAVDDRRAMAQVEHNRGLVYFDRGEISEARARFEALVRIGRELGDPLEEAKGLTNLGMVDIELGDIASALPPLVRARRLYASAGGSTEIQVVLGHIGAAHVARGDFDRAYAVIDTALALARDDSLRSDEAQNLELLASIHAQSGDLRRALEMLHEAGAVHLSLGDDLLAGGDERARAEILAELGNLSGAREAALRALELHRGVDSPWEELRDRLVLAELAARAGDDETADRELDAASSLAAGLDLAAPRAEVALSRARIADERGDAAATLAAIARFRTIGSSSRYSDEWEAAALAARAHSRRGDLDAAIRDGLRAVALVEQVRGRLPGSVLRGSIVAARSRTYAELVRSLVLTGRHEEAFAVSDGARATALAEHLAAGSALGSRDASLRDAARVELLLRRVSRLRTTLETIEALPPEEIDPGGLEDARRLLAEARREYELAAAGRSLDPSGRVRILGIGEVDAAAARSGLGSDEVLIEYLVGPDELFVFVLTNAALTIAVTDMPEATLSSRVRLARERIGRPGIDPEEVHPLLEQLYRDLIQPAFRSAPVIEARRLILVPHGPLAYLPFGALRDPTSGEYLAERYELAHLPTASALPLLRGRSGTTEPERPRMTVFTPFPDELPGSRAEARRIEAAIPGSVVISAEAATERRLRSALSAGDMAHVATHGSLVVESPLFSRIDLASGGEDPADDGVLEVHEVLSQPVTSPLVFLSGCETGLGRAWSDRFTRGEDYATLAQAFLYSGARQVVATLWPIEDEGAAAFAGAFYERLAEGKTASEALAAARRTLLRSERFSAPFYWAGYRLSG